MGISVTQSTIHKKKKILVKQQEYRIKATAQAYTEQRKLILPGEAVIDSDSQRNDEILWCDHQSFADLDILSAKSKLDIQMDVEPPIQGVKLQHCLIHA